MNDLDKRIDEILDLYDLNEERLQATQDLKALIVEARQQEQDELWSRIWKLEKVIVMIPTGKERGYVHSTTAIPVEEIDKIFEELGVPTRNLAKSLSERKEGNERMQLIL